MKVLDPIKFGKALWPKVVFYKEQRDIIHSVRDNDETYVPAANMMGKDFVGAFIALWFFQTRNPCRIITTSAKEDHLRVLWGEMKNFIYSSRSMLDANAGGNLIVNHREIKKIVNGVEQPLSYIKGMVASADSIAAMQGHHIAQTGDGIPRTLFLVDECSSVPDAYYKMARTWFNRMLGIGNTWHCENFFKHAIQGTPDGKDPGGDIPTPDGKRFYRKVIRIRADQSPNVRFGLQEVASGKEPTGTIIIPGVKPYNDYIKHRELWDEIQQTVSLDAEFYEGFKTLLFPKEWLDLAAARAVELEGTKRVAETMGIDPAEGGDNTVWSVCDSLGLIYQVSIKTPDTSVITDWTIRLIREYNLEPKNVLFDRGGGGKEHADRLRVMGYPVRSVGFGEAAKADLRRGQAPFTARKEQEEEKYAFKNRRSEMYGLLSMKLNPKNGGVFALPAKYNELRRQLAPTPKIYDGEGRLMLPPKNKPPLPASGRESSIVTIIDLIGCSPDEADSLVLAVYGLARKQARIKIGAIR